MRCIDADAFRDRLQNLGYDDWNQGTTTTWAEAFSECADMVEEMPTIEPRCEACEAFNKTRLLIPQPQRKKGKWIYLDKDKRFFRSHIVKCSVCDNILDMYGVNAGRGDANFCPNCGADMRGDSNADVKS